jgi:ATP-dependent exoDNAse (exonuclease V) beta subunit
MADDVEAVATLIEHLDVDMRAAEALLADMLGSRDYWLPLLMSGGDVDQLMATLESEIEKELAQLDGCMPLGWASTLAPLVSRAAAVLAGGEETLDISALLDWQGEVFEAEYADLARWRALADVLLTGTGTLRRTVNKRQGFEAKSDYKDEFVNWLKSADEGAPWVLALAEIRNAPQDGYQPEQLQTLQALIQVLWLASAQLNLRFIETGEVDFVEIAQRAVQALGQADEPTDLLLMLDMTIKHILVDEFQDTSQSQIELLKRLTAGWVAGDGRSLFLVGDPMQSIYRFRKAEVGWFLKVQEQGLGEIPLTTLHLTNNFRSQANVVQWVNEVFGPLFPQDNNSTLGAISYTPSEAFHDGVDGLGVEFHPIWFAADEAAEQAGEVAQKVAVQLAREALERHGDSEHPVAILVRARSHLEDIVLRLTRENIPCRAVELVSLHERQVVIDLAQLARALAHPADRLAWLSVLRSPLCGLTLTSLHSLFGNEHQLTAPRVLSKWLEDDRNGQSRLSAPESTRLRRVANILLDRRNWAGTVPFAAWLEEVWERLGGPVIYASGSDVADAESLFRLIEKLAPYGGLNPVELDAKLAQLYAAPNSTGRAVEVMTIHKSKGLEFETVILTGLHRRPRADTQPMLRFEHNEGELLLGPVKHRAYDDLDPVSVYLSQREKKRASYEADRLLYVGVTRAREQLHLIGLVGLDAAGEPKSPAGSSLLGRLWDYVAKPVPPALSELSEGDAATPVASGPRALVRISDASLLPEEAAMAPAQGGTSWQWRMESGDEATIGTVAHAWLERIGKDGLENWPLERINDCAPVLRTQLSRAGLASTALDAATEAVQQTLAATLSSDKGRWLLEAARAHREWSLLDISGRVSVIDLAIAHEGGWLVVDYKTGVPGANESTEHFAQRMRERYAEQIERYCAHVTALDARPARGALYFPRADLWVDC